MFDKREFQMALLRAGKTTEDIAKLLGRNSATIYRKLSGVSDFTRQEIQLIKMGLSLTGSDIERIFFADKLA